MGQLSFNFILKKIKKIQFPKFDYIVAIGKDGILPASLLQHFLDVPLYIVWLNYRNEQNEPIRNNPKLMKPINKELKNLRNKKILLVDSVSRTGKTLAEAKKLLNGNKIKTFVINGPADYSVINSKECFRLPWT